VADWEQVFTDTEGGNFSTWHGVARDPEHYAVIGHFFVTGVDKPTPEQLQTLEPSTKTSSLNWSLTI